MASTPPGTTSKPGARAYADWTVETEELLQQLDHSDHHHAPLRTVHARGLRILIHVDALLDR